jgi:hypothetical protein
MYLYGQRSASNLGSYLRGGLGRLSYRPNQAVQRIFRRRPPVNYGLRGFRGVGDDSVDITTGYTDPGISTSLMPAYDTSLIPDVTDPTISTSLIPPSSGAFGPSPSQAFSDVQAAAVASQSGMSPTDFTSPAAAVAAGIPSATVQAAWSTPQGVNSFPTQQAAIAAGIAAATVAKLWVGGSNSAAGQQVLQQSGSGFLAQSTAGIPNTVLLVGGGLVLLLGLMSGGKR